MDAAMWTIVVVLATMLMARVEPSCIVGKLPHGQVLYTGHQMLMEGDVVEQKATLYLICDVGYTAGLWVVQTCHGQELTGDTNLHCEPTSCTVGKLPSGQVVYDGPRKLKEGDKARPGATLYLMCDVGYLTGLGAEQTCQGQELTGDTNLKCEPRPCSRFRPAHGKLMRNLLGYERVRTLYHGQHAHIVCSHGYNIGGEPSLEITCQNGGLNPRPQDCTPDAA